MSSRGQNPSVKRECSIRESSPFSISSSNALTHTPNSQYFSYKKSKPVLSTSTSMNIIKPTKVIPEKRIVSTRKTLLNSPKKSVKSGKTSRDTSRPREVQSRGQANQVDRVWRKVINLSNGIEPFAGSFTSYTACIGKGNNHSLVKKVLMTRPWWKIVENKEQANLVWSQWRDKQVLADLKCFNGKNVIKEPLGSALAGAVVRSIVGKKSDLEFNGINLIQRSKSYLVLNNEKIHPNQQRLHNKLEFNYCLTNKKGLHQTMKRFYEDRNENIFDKLPITFNVKGSSCEEFSKFLKLFNSFEGKKSQMFKNIWIVKPGEFSNRGTGITVCKTLEEIMMITKPVADKTYILQKYIENPLLINKRKFDIRCYAMMTSINGVIQGYFYLDGYLRTTSQEYSVDELDPFVHLTNDAIQKHSSDYGKFENGNKLSYREFQKYLDSNHYNINFNLQILPKIKTMVKETMMAAYSAIDSNRRMHCMEIFGYDFMIDQMFKPWLIEVNTNPCLELSAPHLRTIIPAMLENAFKLVLDSLFPAPLGQCKEMQGINRFELVFHSESDGKELEKIGIVEKGADE